VIQIHTSGPRLRNGVLDDAHDSLEEEDWATLQWTLERTRPQIVTLEYFRERSPLLEQLILLRQILD
jgi:uncharacterized protein (UPF0276 family)